MELRGDFTELTVCMQRPGGFTELASLERGRGLWATEERLF